MIKLKQNTKTFGDSTAGYLVILDKEYTVDEFVNEVLTKNEWGYIGIYYENMHWFESGNPKCEYKWNKLISKLPDDILNKKISSVTAHGGWSNMDYLLKLQ